MVRAGARTDFVMADIPGLIEGAHKGAGMGDRFLRHVERTRVLLHLIDPLPHEDLSPEERFATIMGELASYSEDLVKTPMIAVITKMDLPENREPAAKLKKVLSKKGIPVHEISAITGEGVKELLHHTAKLLKKIRTSQ